MTNWTSEELNQIGTAEELQIASLRQDGTLRKLVIIWVWPKTASQIWKAD